MSALVAILKRVLIAALTNKKFRNTLIGIILGILVIVMLPAAALVAVLNGDFEIDYEGLQEKVEERLSDEEIEEISDITETMEEIEDAMLGAGHSEQKVQEAYVLYVLALSDLSEEENFVSRLVGCFAEEQTDEELVANINATFGKSVDATEFTQFMEGVRSVYIDTSDYIDSATKNNMDLVKYATHALENKWGYVWGTYGQILSEKKLKSLIEQYPDDVGSYEDFIRKNWLGGRTADCGGLIKGYMWLDVTTNEMKYGSNGMPGIRADGIYEAATEKGTIDTIPEIAGLAVWQKGHIGVYIGNGEVIEAMNTKKGVVKTKLSSGKWTHWLKVPNLIYLETEGLN